VDQPKLLFCVSDDSPRHAAASSCSRCAAHAPGIRLRAALSNASFSSSSCENALSGSWLPLLLRRPASLRALSTLQIHGGETARRLAAHLWSSALVAALATCSPSLQRNGTTLVKKTPLVNAESTARSCFLWRRGMQRSSAARHASKCVPRAPAGTRVLIRLRGANVACVHDDQSWRES
jgi:hypothetical protein